MEFFNKTLAGQIELSVQLTLNPLFKKVFLDDKGSYIELNGIEYEVDKDGKNKLQAARVMKFIYYYCFWKSPFYFEEEPRRYSEALRMSTITNSVKRIGYNNNWSIDEILEQIDWVETYQRKTSPTLGLRDEKHKFVQKEVKLLTYFNTQMDKAQQKLDDFSRGSGPNVHALASGMAESEQQIIETIMFYQDKMTSISSKMTAIRKQLNDYEDTIHKELSESGKVYSGDTPVGLTELDDEPLSKYLR